MALVALLTLILILNIVVCGSQNSCIKWLESIDGSFPYLSAHNSYHIRTTHLFDINNNFATNVTIPRWGYTNPSLTELLSNGVVGIEIDIKPQNDVSGTNDFPVYHWKTIDEMSTCDTFRKCLTEINEWYILNKNTLITPLLLYIDITNIKDYSESQLELINSIWTQIFNINDLYTPSIHNGNDTNSLQYIDWSNVCYDDIKNKMIPLINDEYGKSINQDTLLNINMFQLCDCQTQETYCIVLQDQCNDDNLAINATNRLKYLYRQYTPLTPQYLQWYQYPLIYNESKEYGKQLLGFQVNDQLINEIHNRFPQYIDHVINPLTIDEWQYWQTAAFIDSIGNNNGKWEADDMIYYLKILDPDASMVDFGMKVLFWKEGYEGWDILNPLLWAKIDCIWNTDDWGLHDDFVINVNLSQTLIQICNKIDKKYHYLFVDYPYNWTYFQDFTMKEIQTKNMCQNITITTDIKQSNISSDCVSKSELLTLIYIIIASIIVGSIIIIIIITIIIYCCLCYKKGGCHAWCTKRCCQCCCSCCIKDGDYSIENQPEEEETMLTGNEAL